MAESTSFADMMKEEVETSKAVDPKDLLDTARMEDDSDEEPDWLDHPEEDDEEVVAEEVVPEEEEEVPQEDEATLNLKEAAANWEALVELFKADPKACLRQLKELMPAKDAAEFMDELKQEVVPEEPDFVPESPAEELLLKHLPSIKQFPAFAERVAQEISRRDVFINDAHIRLAVAEAKLSAVLNFIDAKLPDIDMKSLESRLKAGDTYIDAVSKVYKPLLEKTVKTVKQAKVERPITPGQRSLAKEEIKKGDTLKDILKKLQ